MAKPWEQHERIIVETYDAIKSNKSSRRHVRPIQGQKHSSKMDVRFPRAIRDQYPVGTKFKCYAKLTDREGGRDFLSTYHSWPLEVYNEAKKEWELVSY